MYKIKCIRYSYFFLVICFCSFTAWTQQITDTNADSLESVKEDTYTIVDIQYKIVGQIIKTALALKLSLINNISFDSLDTLIRYVHGKRAQLINLRQLKTISTITFTQTWNEEKQQYDVILHVYAFADGTFFVLPYFKYSTSDGLLLSARVRDYNFLGSLEKLSVDLDYIFDTSSRHKYKGYFAFKYPITVGKHTLIPGLGESISWRRPDNNFFNDTKLFLEYYYPISKAISFNSSLEQRLVFEGDFGMSIHPFGESSIAAGVSITLNKEPYPVIDTISYSPEVKFTAKYPLSPNDPNPSSRTADDVSFSQSISFGRIDLINNFRTGLSVSLSNSNTYVIRTELFRGDVSLETKFHKNFWDVFGINTRLYGVQYYYYDLGGESISSGGSLGSRIQGVLDSNFDSVFHAIVLNSEILFKLFSLRALLLDEAQLGPFFDIAIRRRIEKEFDPNTDIKYTVGISGIAFSIYRSIFIRVSYGLDLGRAIKEGRFSFANREIFIGLSLFY